MRPYLQVFLRGVVHVALVTGNTRLVAFGAPAGIPVSALISWLWWSNSSKGRPDVKGGGIVYGLGAACGTALGYLIAGWLAGA